LPMIQRHRVSSDGTVFRSPTKTEIRQRSMLAVKRDEQEYLLLSSTPSPYGLECEGLASTL